MTEFNLGAFVVGFIAGAMYLRSGELARKLMEVINGWRDK